MIWRLAYLICGFLAICILSDYLILRKPPYEGKSVMENEENLYDYSNYSTPTINNPSQENYSSQNQNNSLDFNNTPNDNPPNEN